MTAELTPTEQALALLAVQGKDLAEIAEEQGVQVSTVQWHLSRIRKKGVNLPRQKRGPKGIAGFKVAELPPLFCSRMKPAAMQRDLSVGQLATKLLKHIAEDDLVDAVLDDQEGFASAEAKATREST